MRVVHKLRIPGFRSVLCAPTWWQRKVLDFLIWRGRTNIYPARYDSKLYWVTLNKEQQ